MATVTTLACDTAGPLSAPARRRPPASPASAEPRTATGRGFEPPGSRQRSDGLPCCRVGRRAARREGQGARQGDGDEPRRPTPCPPGRSGDDRHGRRPGQFLRIVRHRRRAASPDPFDQRRRQCLRGAPPLPACTGQAAGLRPRPAGIRVLRAQAAALHAAGDGGRDPCAHGRDPQAARGRPHRCDRALALGVLPGPRRRRAAGGLSCARPDQPDGLRPPLVRARARGRRPGQPAHPQHRGFAFARTAAVRPPRQPPEHAVLPAEDLRLEADRRSRCSNTTTGPPTSRARGMRPTASWPATCSRPTPPPSTSR